MQPDRGHKVRTQRRVSLERQPIAARFERASGSAN
jgi:hypothetical protein